VEVLEPRLLLSGSITGSNSANEPIPDGGNDTYGNWAFTSISISGAPAGAVVTDVDVEYLIHHAYAGDLQIDVDVQNNDATIRIRDREGAEQDNPSATLNGIDVFDDLNPNRTWYLYARDGQALDAGYIDDWNITVHYDVPTQLPGMPTGLDPANSDAISDLTPTLDWNSASNADTYEVNISQYPYGGANIVYTQSGITSSSHAVPSGVLVNGTQYRWDVTAVNSAGEVTSDNAYFQTVVAAPSVPVHVAPSSNGTTDGPSVTFRWNQTANATKYELYVRDLTTDELSEYTIIGGSTTQKTLALIEGRRYRWNMQAFNGSTGSGYSNPWEFDVNDTLPTTYSITPNPATVNEDDGSQSFTVTRSGGLPTETVYVSTTQDQGYTNSGDYSGLLNQSVAFALNQTQKTLTVSITNDTTVENNEAFGLIAQRHSSDPISTYLAKTTFTIIDNDSPNSVTYDRNTAVQYAQQFANFVGSDGYFWEWPDISASNPAYLGSGQPVPTGSGIDGGVGDDCAHFVSLSIGSESHQHGGGLAVPNTTGTNAYGIPSAQGLTTWLLDNYADAVVSVSSLSLGDVIAYDWESDGHIDHVSLYTGNSQIAAHSASRLNYAWNGYQTTYPSLQATFVHIRDSAPVITGDMNSDGFVGIEDLNIVLGNWNQAVTPGDLLFGDPTGDGFVGIGDLNVVLGNWNAGTPPLAEVRIDQSVGQATVDVAERSESIMREDIEPVASSSGMTRQRPSNGTRLAVAASNTLQARDHCGHRPDRNPSHSTRAGLAVWTQMQRRLNRNGPGDQGHTPWSLRLDETRSELGLWEEGSIT
jgi:subtilisin-like proprotein convertase family protein